MSNMPMSTQSSNNHKNLSQILEYLNPPQQDYQRLAADIGVTPQQDFATSIEKLLAIYFQLFASGYAFWQQDYDYSRIHEFFYGAYLAATTDHLIEGVRQDGASNNAISNLKNFLFYVTRTFIHNTGCENALIGNMPTKLEQSAHWAGHYCQKALELLQDSQLQKVISLSLRSPIEQYLMLNKTYFEGVKLCAQLSLVPYQRKGIPADLSAKQQQIETIMKEVLKSSRELFSELRAYYASATNAIDSYRQRGLSSLRIMQADIQLRAIGYIGENLLKPLFKRFEDQDIDEVIELAHQKLQFDIQLHSGGFLNDAFKTAAGIELLESLIIDFPIEEDTLSLQVPDGDSTLTYSIESVRINLSRFSAVAVEFAFSAGDMEKTRANGVSVAHLRTLESLVGPHIGQFDIIWQSSLDQTKPEVNNFVQYYLQCQDWLDEGDDKGWLPVDSTLTEIKDKLRLWEQLLDNFAHRLPLTPTEFVYDRNLSRTRLQAVLTQIRQSFQEWAWLQDDTDNASKAPELQDYRLRGRLLFPSGHVFNKLMDIAAEIMGRIEEFLRSLADTEKPKDVFVERDDAFLFDSSSGWQSIIAVNRLALEEADGKIVEPYLPSEIIKLHEHPEFLGFAVTGREARAGIDDWLLAAPPEGQKNLALVRSHRIDVVYVGQNRALFFLPDDPMFILTQYIDSVRFFGDLRNVLLAHLVIATDLIRECNKCLDNIDNADKSHFSANIHHIEKLRRQIDRVFEIVDDLTLTKYQDHSMLMREITLAMRLGDTIRMLHTSSETLNTLRNYLLAATTK